MVDSGNPAAKAAAYDDPAVREAFPMADLIRESINDAGPRPVTPYYNDVSDVGAAAPGIPPATCSAPRDAGGDRRFMTDVLQRQAAPVS